MNGIPRRNRTAVRQSGDRYQHLVAWNEVLNALLNDRDATAVSVEDPDGGNVDDVVVYRHNGSHTYIQVKHAVDATTPVGHRWMTTSPSVNAKSLLQKFHESWSKLSSGQQSPQLRLVTDREIDPSDKVMKHLDRSTELLVPDIQQAQADVGRRDWAEHLQISEEELILLLGDLKFMTGRPIAAERERALTLMQAAGLNHDQSALDSAVILIEDWVQLRNRRLSLSELRASAHERIGIERSPGALVVIEGIDSDPHPDDATHVIRYVDQYIEDDPYQRRQLRDPTAWSQIGSEIKQAAERLRGHDITRVVVRGAMRLPTWFAAGAAFRDVRGFEVAALQHGQAWSSEDLASPPPPDTMRATNSHVGQGPDLALAVGIAADPTDEVRDYVSAVHLPVKKVTSILPQEGPNSAAVSSSAAAASVAVNVRDAVRRALRDFDAEHIHLFLATPGVLALLLGHRWNSLRSTTIYEHLGPGRSYEPTFQINA